MSASNWAVCPRCVDNAMAQANEKLAEIAAAYGTMPLPEFDKLRATIKPIDPERYRTFREDYEIYGAREGTVTISYSGHCGTCGLGLDFKDERKLWP